MQKYIDHTMQMHYVILQLFSDIRDRQKTRLHVQKTVSDLCKDLPWQDECPTPFNPFGISHSTWYMGILLEPLFNLPDLYQSPLCYSFTKTF